MALTLSREKYQRFFSSASGDDKTSRLLLYAHGGGDKSLRLPLSSGRGGDCADFGGIGSRILIDHIWFGGSIDSDDGSALDRSIDGGDSDWRGGQFIAIGGGDAWRRSNDSSVVFDGGGGMSRADLYPRWSVDLKETVATASGFERKAGVQPSSGGGDGVWSGFVPFGAESSVLLMVMDSEARSVFIDVIGRWGGNQPGRGGLAVALWRSFATARLVGGGGAVPLAFFGVPYWTWACLLVSWAALGLFGFGWAAMFGLAHCWARKAFVAEVTDKEEGMEVEAAAPLPKNT